jgi:broad specificity phosphatase PhoE
MNTPAGGLRDTELTETGRQYAAAYAAHYTERNLPWLSSFTGT